MTPRAGFAEVARRRACCRTIQGPAVAPFICALLWGREPREFRGSRGFVRATVHGRPAAYLSLTIREKRSRFRTARVRTRSSACRAMPQHERKRVRVPTR